ncbi:MerR family transcriptional regulator [Listeria rocourtiae]|uniref:MerR family transcriptional regulator n=1 Tax=Listeria rocourtiae TaxID=647910 RepID=UPI0016231E16|nr:MerR family transcriptional regulator [Listeria rocourtiae]MBC1436129.1 MerR family transcriptional regulator [Listeria rocourtiae]
MMRGHELSKLLGVPVSTLHYYEKKGLIQPKRGENQYREYSAQDTKIMKYILILKEAGFSLAEISEVMHRYLRQPHSADCQAEAQIFFHAKIHELQQKIEQYQTIITILEDLPVMLGEEPLTKIQEKNDVLVDTFFNQKGWK